MNELITWFGLKRYPFDKEIRVADLVDTEPLRECAARLDYMRRRGGIMLLTGDPGVGKTVALRRFVDSLNENLFRAIYTPLTTLKGADLLRHINDKLGLTNRAAKGTIYRQIQEEILDSREQRGRTVLLIVDESHLLQVGALQELRLLTNFKMDSFDPFILILAGQSDLRRTMDFAVMEPFAQRLAMRYHMSGLSRQETAEYIGHQLKLAGSHGPVFGDDAVAAIHEATYGIPRKIGALAEQAMTYAMFADKRTVDADMVLKVKVGG
jgi:general secretion pathway protein A